MNFRGSSFHESFHELFRVFSWKLSRFIPRKLSLAFDGSLHEAVYRSYLQGGLNGSSWKLSFTEATSMKAAFMSVWMGASTKTSMNFTRKQLPGFGCFRRICRSNFRTFGGNGSRSSSRGSFHGSSFHGRLRGSSGCRTTSPSPSLREQGPSSKGSAIHHPWPTPMEEVREISRAHSFVTKYLVPNRHSRLDAHVFHGIKYQTRTHGPTRTSFHGNFQSGCTACTAA